MMAVNTHGVQLLIECTSFWQKSGRREVLEIFLSDSVVVIVVVVIQQV